MTGFYVKENESLESIPVTSTLLFYILVFTFYSISSSFKSNESIGVSTLNKYSFKESIVCSLKNIELFKP